MSYMDHEQEIKSLKQEMEEMKKENVRVFANIEALGGMIKDESARRSDAISSIYSAIKDFRAYVYDNYRPAR